MTIATIIDILMLQASPLVTYYTGMVCGIFGTIMAVALYRAHVVREQEIRDIRARPYNYEDDSPYRMTPNDIKRFIDNSK